MFVKELKKILEEYDDDAEVIGVDWSNGNTFDINVGGDDDDEGSKYCRIGFDWISPHRRKHGRINQRGRKNERNISVTFSKKVVKEFEEKNNLDLICRAHQVVEEGFEFFAEMKLVTIFTAPNYMGEFDNNGGILEVGEDLLCKFHVLRPNFERSGKRRKITRLVN